MLSLTPTLRRELRARAHPLHPVVAIGNPGLTPSVLHEIDVALTAHELVKVRVHSDERDERERLLAEICEGLGAGAVQHLGKVLIVWRPKPAAERVEERPRAHKGKSARRRDERASPKGSPRGALEPKVGIRARKHRRGAARHDPDASTAGGRPANARRRSTRPAKPEPVVPTTAASRGARYAQGQPVGKGRRPPPSDKRAPADESSAGKRRSAEGASTGKRRSPDGASSGKRGSADGTSAGQRRPSGGAPAGKRGSPGGAPAAKRAPPSEASAGKRRPTTSAWASKRGPTGDAPAGVTRRRRPTGGR